MEVAIIMHSAEGVQNPCTLEKPRVRIVVMNVRQKMSLSGSSLSATPA
jgi:hypothetical protein